jgi:D-alanyl-D-alanine carboxypeptidase
MKEKEGSRSKVIWIVILYRGEGMKLELAKQEIEQNLIKIVESDTKIPNAYLLIHSDQHDIHWSMAHGKADRISVNPNQPYHTASIAKTFTAMMIAKLVEEGKLHYKDVVNKYLPDDLMKNLHIYKDRDFSHEITLQQLISNTSGLGDFYEDKPKQGKHFLDIMLDEPSRYWSANETIEWTKQHISPRFKPGEKVHYTNTGFNLLGLVIEKVTGKSYHEALHEMIFQPLQMNHTYLSQYSKPAEQNPYPVAKLNIKNKEINVEDFRSFSSIYAGGQTVSTSEDLLKFMKALVGSKIVDTHTLESMKQWKNMWIGVDYGYGLMRVRMLPIIQKYNVWGHLGSIGSFMLYNPDMDIYLIGNFNKSGHLTKTVRFLFKTLRTVSKGIG